MSRFPLLALTLFALMASGCSRDVLAPGDEPPADDATQVVRIPHVDRTELDQMLQQSMMPDGGLAVIGKGRKMVEVPEGSVDALADAIAAAGRNGIVLLKAGEHHESAMVEIPFAITLIGEEGAELVTSAGGLVAAPPIPVAPVLHVTGSHATIRGVTFRPASGDGNAAILIDGASHTTVFGNDMTGYQFPVIVASGDYNRVWNNTIVVNGAWQTGAVAFAFGITVVRGNHASVMDNAVSNAVWGFFTSGLQGQLAYNTSQGNYVGIVMCKVSEALILPGGELIGAEFATKDWVVAHNTTMNNFTTGLLVIDGSNNNVIANNESSGNGTFDVDLTGDTNRLGFFTPASFENTFIAGAYEDIEVRDCGIDNTIIGGALVDNSVVPCD